MRTVEDIVDTGLVDSEVPTPVLDDSLVVIEWRINTISGSHWVNTLIGQGAILWCQDVANRIQQELNRRRGLDGMTELG
ncbi:hypothetical protein [Spirosoma oryzicola]|uniref:hypothetical protein n=1 Tax=Spirosoma oryzicola TaxID=2898794 RepID=UPI001E5F4C6F|nr:hypothetical protein [Spirosoma oryzicola]UHG93458.1 hypothetical protein LQ777_11250 [Spirosoma oryzicola]